MKNISLILLIIICMGLFSCADSSSGKRFKKEYEKLNNNHYKVSIQKDNPFVYSNIKEINKLVDSKDNFVMFVGQASDNWSRHLSEIIIAASKELDIEKVYYIESSDKQIDEFAKKQKIDINIPSLVVFKKGKIKSLYNTLDDSEKNPKEKFNKTYYKKILTIVKNTLKA